MRYGTKPTIREVADQAGVSLTTVSYVLSGRHGGTTRISQPTQDRVRTAAEKLGYVANQAARGMRRGRTDLVAVAIGDLESDRDRAVAIAAARILPQHGYQAVILLGDSWRRFMLSGGADGVILASVAAGAADDATILELARRGVAHVKVTALEPSAGLSAGSEEPDVESVVATLVHRLATGAPGGIGDPGAAPPPDS